MSFVSAIKRLSPIQIAHAHCDIPCGIYDPIAAKIAAQTVLKMVMRIQALPDSGDASRDNSLGRYITVKEEHAEIFKNEVDILWHDYFRPEHAEAHPDLHETVWNAAKLASANKQGVDLDAAQRLVEAADRISEIYWATKGVEYSDPVAEIRFGT